MDNVCGSKEFEPVEVEATIMDTVNGTFPYVKSEHGGLLDQQENYMEDNKEHLMTILEGEVICQLCKRICVHDFMSVQHLEVDFIPEVKFSISGEPIVCSSCFDSLNTHRPSIRNSSDVQDEISNTSEENDGIYHIKTEEIEIKSEEDGDRICDEELCSSQTSQNHQVTQEAPSAHHQPTSEDGSKPQMYQCGKCAFRTKYKGSLKSHELTHKDISKVLMYKCRICEFKTKSKYYLERHELKHDDPNIKTRYKGVFDVHRSSHDYVSEVLIHKCDICPYKSKYRATLVHHQLQHRIDSKVQVDACDVGN